jgi:hypothetical protein
VSCIQELCRRAYLQLGCLGPSRCVFAMQAARLAATCGGHRRGDLLGHGDA